MKKFQSKSKLAIRRNWSCINQKVKLCKIRLICSINYHCKLNVREYIWDLGPIVSDIAREIDIVLRFNISLYIYIKYFCFYSFLGSLDRAAGLLE